MGIIPNSESDAEELLYQLDVALKERDDDFMRKADEPE